MCGGLYLCTGDGGWLDGRGGVGHGDGGWIGEGVRRGKVHGDYFLFLFGGIFISQEHPLGPI